MSVLRIVDAAFNNYANQYVMTVDVLKTPDEEDHTYLISVPRNKIYTEDDLKRYIEQEIVNRRKADPDYKGLTWKCDQI